MLFKSYIKTAYKTVEKRLIPGFNADISEMQKIAQVLKGINYKKAELLPYNPMAKYKYDALGMEFTDYPVLKEGEIEKFQTLFAR